MGGAAVCHPSKKKMENRNLDARFAQRCDGQENKFDLCVLLHSDVKEPFAANEYQAMVIEDRNIKLLIAANLAQWRF